MIIFKLSVERDLNRAQPKSLVIGFSSLPLTIISLQNFHRVSQKSIPCKFSERLGNLLESEWLQHSADLRLLVWRPCLALLGKRGCCQGKQSWALRSLLFFQWSLWWGSPCERYHVYTLLFPLANRICVLVRGSEESSGIAGDSVFLSTSVLYCFRNNLWCDPMQRRLKSRPCRHTS